MLIHDSALGSGNSPFQQHKEDLRVGRDVLHSRGASANLPTYNVAKQMHHILLSLWWTTYYKSKRANSKCVVSAQSNISSSRTEVVVIQTFQMEWYAPQNQSSVDLLWVKWGGWCCRALELVGPLPQSEAPCLRCQTAPLSAMQDFLILPLQPTGKTVSFSDSVTDHGLLKHLHRDFNKTKKKDWPFHISCFQMIPASPSMPHSPSDSSQSLQGSSETSRRGMAWF